MSLAVVFRSHTDGGRVVSAAHWLLRLAIAGLYLFAAWEKIIDPLGFSKAIFNYRLLPMEAIVPLALMLPVWETLAGIGLVFGRFYRGSVASILLMSIVFAVGVGSAIARGLDLSCGCFGSGVDSQADWGHIALNAATAAAAIWLLLRAHRRASARSS